MEFEFAVCLAVPAMVAWAITQLRRPKWFRWGAGATGLAVAIAWLSGYWVLVSGQEWWPERTWHWLPYLSLLAGVMGAVSVGEKWSTTVRSVLATILALLFGYTMVPNWQDLWPSRGILIGSLIVYAVVSIGLLMRSANETANAVDNEVKAAKRRLLWMAAAFLALTVAGLAGYGITYAKLALIGGSAMCGVAFAMKPCGRSPAGLQAVVAWYVVVAGGIAFTAAIYPPRPRFELMLLPLTPLIATWLGALGRRLTGKSGPLLYEAIAAIVWIVAVLSIAILA